MKLTAVGSFSCEHLYVCKLFSTSLSLSFATSWNFVRQESITAAPWVYSAHLLTFRIKRQIIIACEVAARASYALALHVRFRWNSSLCFFSSANSLGNLFTLSARIYINEFASFSARHWHSFVAEHKNNTPLRTVAYFFERERQCECARDKSSSYYCFSAPPNLKLRTFSQISTNLYLNIAPFFLF